MNYVVMQSKSSKKVMDAGIIWAPVSKGNTNIHHWERVNGVEEGDIIFQVENGKITAIARAKTGAAVSRKPEVLEDNKEWGEFGYIVEVEYWKLNNPLVVKDHIDEIKLLLPQKYSPFQENGNGNQGYLFPCNDQLTMKLIEIIKFENTQKILDRACGSHEDEENAQAIVILEKTEYETTVKARRGHELYKSELSKLWNYKCPICGIKEIPSFRFSLLVGSHSKPWKDSEPHERLDKYNGLLLCKNHDALFDKGVITFSPDNGQIMISSVLPVEEYEKYFLNKNVMIVLNDQQRKYMRWHKEFVFEKAIKK